MKCLIIFGAENAHPLAWLLDRKKRHVWCALQDTERGMWISYNWHQGIPVITAEAPADYDLATHYQAQGYAVVETERGTAPCLSLLMLNNCVGHVKLVCAIRSRALTPYQLYRSLTTRWWSIAQFKRLFTAPGFGGSTPAPPPPPPPLPPEPNAAGHGRIKTLEEEAARVKKQRMRQAGKKKDSGSNLLPSGGRKTDPMLPPSAKGSLLSSTDNY